MSKLVDINEKIAEKVVDGYKKIEEKFTETFLNEDGSLKTGKAGQAVVDGYKKIEEGAVEGFEKVNDKIIEKVFAKTGETVEDAKKRLNGDKN